MSYLNGPNSPFDSWQDSFTLFSMPWLSIISFVVKQGKSVNKLFSLRE